MMNGYEGGAQPMSREVFEQGYWAAVIDKHALESRDPADWLSYGVALLQSIDRGAGVGCTDKRLARLGAGARWAAERSGIAAHSGSACD
jgi:hypothetical protein